MYLNNEEIKVLKLFLSDKWNIYQPDLNNPFCVNVFDDGNEKYKNNTNIWYKVGDWKEKICLLNKDERVFIYSISSWKVLSIKKITSEYQYVNDYMIRMKEIMSSLPDEYKNKDCQEIENKICNYLKKYCIHEIIDDYIDINPELSQPVKYCNKCYTEF
tara:strand:- start:481 stop:957 length:477 start_codon:yes stop_codon:yes gene_type:complete